MYRDATLNRNACFAKLRRWKPSHIHGDAAAM